jgi:hypothetical protein
LHLEVLHPEAFCTAGEGGEHLGALIDADGTAHPWRKGQGGRTRAAADVEHGAAFGQRFTGHSLGRRGASKRPLNGPVERPHVEAEWGDRCGRQHLLWDGPLR